MRLRASLTSSSVALLVLDQAQREFLVVIVRSQVGHMQRNVRQIARPAAVIPPQRFVSHLTQVATKSSPQSLKRLPISPNSSVLKAPPMNPALLFHRAFIFVTREGWNCES